MAENFLRAQEFMKRKERQTDRGREGAKGKGKVKGIHENSQCSDLLYVSACVDTHTTSGLQERAPDTALLHSQIPRQVSQPPP